MRCIYWLYLLPKCLHALFSKLQRKAQNLILGKVSTMETSGAFSQNSYYLQVDIRQALT